MKTMQKFLVAFLAACSAACGQGYLITDIAPGVANAVNIHGQVAGTSEGRGFYYDGSALLAFNMLSGNGTPIGVTASTATAINDAGYVGGWFQGIPGGVGLSISGSYLFHAGTNITGFSYAYKITDIDAAGTVVGYTETSTDEIIPVPVFSRGVYQGYSAPLQRYYAVNSHGVVAGYAANTTSEDAQTAEAELPRACYTTNNTVVFIDSRSTGAPLPWQLAEAQTLSVSLGINNSGHIVGWFRDTANTYRHAFRYTGTAMQDIGTLGGTNSIARRINSAGVIVGEAELANGTAHAFLYDGGVMTDLNTLLPSGSGWELLSANDINDYGEIVGQGRHNGQLRAYLLTSPASIPLAQIQSLSPDTLLILSNSLSLSVTATGRGPITYQWKHAGTNIVGATNSAFSVASATLNHAGTYRVLVTNPRGTVESDEIHVTPSGSATGYEIADLGLGVANDINNLGHVVGDSGFFGFFHNGETRHLFTNIVGYVRPPGTFGGSDFGLSTWTTAVAVNDLDEIIGMRNDGLGFPDRWSFVYPHIITNFGSAIQLEGYDMVATDINNSGRITGHRNIGDRSAVYVSYIAGGGTQAEVGQWSQLYAINGSGIAAGTLGTPSPLGGFYPGRAMTASANGTPTLIDNRATPASSIALGINDDGVVVGWMTSAAGAPYHAFRSTGSGIENLGTLGGTNSVANDINASGVIVGNAEIASGITHAFRYSDGTMTDLNTLVLAGSGWELLSANAINNRGEIVGQGRFQGELRAYKLSPNGLANPPLIETDPLGARLALGASHTLSVAAIGTGPFTYQWTFNGTNIVNATNSTVTISPADAFSVGDYRVLVTNSGGTVFSRIARIDVLDPELTGVQLFGLKIGGSIGATYRVEFRPSAGVSTWTALTNVTLVTSPQLWVDLQSVENAHRLYRAVRLP